LRNGSATMSAARSRGLSDEYGSWKTACSSRRNGRIAARPSASMRCPRHAIVPAVGSTSRRIVLPAVDLPQPDSPTSPSVSPAPIAKLIPSTACTFPAARPSSPCRTG
jgi:hypothetical protein